VRRFSFRLESVLRLRDQIEQQAKVSMARATEERNRAERALYECYAAIEAETRRLRGEEASGEVDIDYVMRSGRYIYYLRVCLAGLFKKLQQAEVELEKQRQQLVRARRDKRSLELLRERCRGRWLVEASREEQGEFDEMAAARYRGGPGMEKSQ